VSKKEKVMLPRCKRPLNLQASHILSGERDDALLPVICEQATNRVVKR
jgi:hypothetical protein